MELALFCRDFEMRHKKSPGCKILRYHFPWIVNRQNIFRIKKKKPWAQRVIEFQALVEEKRQNELGGGRKMSEINAAVYPHLKEAMVTAARNGGDTTRREQCVRYKQIALKLGFTEADFPEEVLNERMQRFDKHLQFTLRACNQKKI